MAARAPGSGLDVGKSPKPHIALVELAAVLPIREEGMLSFSICQPHFVEPKHKSVIPGGRYMPLSTRQVASEIRCLVHRDKIKQITDGRLVRCEEKYFSVRLFFHHISSPNKLWYLIIRFLLIVQRQSPDAEEMLKWRGNP